MRLTITDGNQFINLDVDSNEEVQNVKALIEAEMGLPFDRQALYFENKLLKNNDKLDQIGVKEDAMLFLQVSPVSQPRTQQNKPKLGIADMIKQHASKAKSSINEFNIPKRSLQEFKIQAERIQGQIKYDLHRLSSIQQSDPEVAKAIKADNSDQLAKLLMKKHDEKMQKFINEQRKFAQLSKDPMNPEYQRMLQERIHQQNIEKNLQFANEYIPEVFGSITMLYINATINKIPIQAFVDTGAQSTIMSESLAKKCGLMRLVDKRAAGMAVGVGTCKILGKIHAADIQIEDKIITCSFTVIQNNGVQFLLGLDMLKRFSCQIDLKKNTLNFQDGLIITKFLGEGQITKNKSANKISPEQIRQKVKKLSQMGFSEVDCIQALKQCQYNQELAATILMQNRFGK